MKTYVAQRSEGLYQALTDMNRRGILKYSDWDNLNVRTPIEYTSERKINNREDLDVKLPITKDDKPLVLNGSGWLHHSTYSFVANNPYQQEFSILNIDNHGDGIEHLPSKDIHCGHFFSNIVNDFPQVYNAVWFYHDGKMAFNNKARNGTALPEFFVSDDKHPSLLEKFLQRNIYLSLDLDCLTKSDMQTDWTQGEMTLTELLGILDYIGDNYNIIGADICGLSRRGVDQKSIDNYVQIYQKFEEIMLMY